MAGHFTPGGGVRMVNVGDKDVTSRRARATGRLRITAPQYTLLQRNQLAKGDWRTVAQVAGIQGAKKCAELVPLCHPLPLDAVHLDVKLARKTRTVEVVATVLATARTGVEMEALSAVSAALLAIYDMIKGVDKGATIAAIQLEEKSGGRSGHWQRGRSSATTPKK
jgi:cyclic pyranopterin phosphate synthase